MTYHGSGRASLENAVSRAISREKRAKKIAAWFGKKRQFVRHREAYERARQENIDLGLNPKRATAQEVVLRMHKVSRRMVTMPGAKPVPKISEREAAEDRMVAAVRDAVEKLAFQVHALSQIPNPDHRYRNKVSQKAVIDLTRSLCKAVIPELPDPFLGAPEIQKVRLPLTRRCFNCGGPGRVEFGDEWLCEACYEDRDRWL